MWGFNEKAAVCKPGEGPSPDPRSEQCISRGTWTAVLWRELPLSSASQLPRAGQFLLLSRCLFFSFSFNPVNHLLFFPLIAFIFFFLNWPPGFWCFAAKEPWATNWNALLPPLSRFLGYLLVDDTSPFPPSRLHLHTFMGTSACRPCLYSMNLSTWQWLGGVGRHLTPAEPITRSLLGVWNWTFWYRCTSMKSWDVK